MAKMIFFRNDDWRLLKSQRELDHSNLTVGELLKKKAEDGVRVLLMIWGETTSIMGTHDTETENFFKGKYFFEGCRRSSVDSSLPSILPPWVRIPSTTSTLL